MSHLSTLEGMTAAQTALVNALQTITLDGKAVKVYDHDPGLVAGQTFISVATPALNFPTVGSTQRQMGTYDVEFTWPCYIYINATNLKFASVSSYKLMGAFADVIEANQTLDLTCEDVRVEEMNPEFVFEVGTGGATAMVIECTIRGYLFINS